MNSGMKIGGTKIRIQLYDVLFFFLLVLSFYFTRNMICRLMMVAFFGYTVLRQLLARRRAVLPFFCFGFLIFILYGAGSIFWGNVMDSATARTMVGSLVLNLMMIYAIVQYICMQKSIIKVLQITEAAIMTTAVIVVVLSLGTITQGRLASETEMNANFLSMLCVYGFALTLYLRKIRKLSLKASLARMGMYILSILLTGSRKGLIMVVLVVLMINMMGGSRKLLKTVFISGAVTVALYILIMNVPVLYNIMGVRIENLINLLLEGSTSEGSLNSRKTLALR